MYLTKYYIRHNVHPIYIKYTVCGITTQTELTVCTSYKEIWSRIVDIILVVIT